MLLEDKVALVTGSTHNIGLGIARAFAREGAKVIVHSRHEEEQITQSRHDRTNDKRQLRTVTDNESAGPTRKQRHDQYERQQGRARGSRRVPLNLNQI